MWQKIRVFIRSKLISPFLEFLKMGISPHKLALAISWAVAWGISPLLGLTTLLCALTAFMLRLNMAVMQLVNYFVYPLQIAFIVPFMYLGRMFIYERTEVPDLASITELFAGNWWDAFVLLWQNLVNALVAWAVVAAPVSVFLYFVLRLVFVRILKNDGSKPQTQAVS